MMCLTHGFSATLAIALLASTAAAADTTIGGKIKSINAEKKTFVVTTDDKDNTFKFDDDLVVNRDGTHVKKLARGSDPHWSPDGRGLVYVNTLSAVSNLWLQPLDGSAPRRMGCSTTA